MFIDSAKIELKAGKGGDGAVAFRREKFEPSGGPFGGDGGDGGSVIIVAVTGIRTLMDFRYKAKYKAENGENGRSKKQYGKRGDDLVLKVPVGTLIKNSKNGKVIYDFTEHEEQFVIAKGGRGGKGNAHFATPVRQAPRFAQPGRKGDEITVVLEIKLLADVGLVGLPNVGKSSLLSIMSDAKPKIANYHFTTLEPNLGVVKVGPEASFVIADIPGLIEGASEGIGLGHEFLKHVERTRLLVHVLDMSGSESRDPIEDFIQINEELKAYNPKLAEKPQIVIANKMDLEPMASENLALFKARFSENYEVYPISAATKKGMENLKYVFWQYLEDMGDTYDTFDEVYDYDESYLEEVDRSINIYKRDNTYIVEGVPIDELVYRINPEDYDSLVYFQKTLEAMDVMSRLRDMGVQEGDVVLVGDLEFDYID